LSQSLHMSIFSCTFASELQNRKIMPINIPSIDVQDVQMIPSIKMEEFNRRVTEYAKALWATMVAEQLTNKRIRPLRSLDPEIGLMCGIVHVPEEDLDGDNFRMEYLEKNI